MDNLGARSSFLHGTDFCVCSHDCDQFGVYKPSSSLLAAAKGCTAHCCYWASSCPEVLVVAAAVPRYR
ncbi:hypothetical protein CEXT_125951 [Caerostris extrusa]|uniref:Uncharacterized protein n=1 Tax=Caerostris extrusa TaxID=172846 RepID=A0AAV4X446_CAEEX|nr:hypothetical protein CEXT_125951 [Caerostris extrusa]